MKPKLTSLPISRADLLRIGGLAILGMAQSLQAAPNVTHNLTAPGDNTWTGATWTGGAPDSTTTGDIATFGASGALTLNAPVTLGSITVGGSGRQVSLAVSSPTPNVLTLNGTGATSGTNGFGHANVASLKINTTGVGSFAIAPDIVLATHTDIGTTSGDDEVTISGHITASSAVTLNFQNDVPSGTSGDVAMAVTGSIGLSGSNIAITNNSAANGDGGSVTLGGILGTSVTGVTQNSPTSAVNLNGANTYAGPNVVNLGTLSVGAAGTLGATTNTLTINNTNVGAASNVVVNLSSGNDITTGTLSGTLATATSGLNTATINTRTGRNFTVNQTSAGTYQGVIAGPGAFTLGGLSTNTLTLSGINTYSGLTTINAGTLNVTGSLDGIGAVAVNGGGTLKGSGSITGYVTVAGGNTAPTQGTLDLTNGSAGTLFLNGGLMVGGAGAGLASVMKFDVGASPDTISLGAADFTVDSGGANLSITNIGGLAAGQSYSLMSFTNGLGAGFATGTGTTVGGLTLTNPSLSFGVSGVLEVTSAEVKLVTTGAATPTTAYWQGNKGATWAATAGAAGNFTTNAAGTTFVQAYPGATTNVIYSATGASNLTHTLGQAFAVNSVTFTSPSAVNLNADGNTLTVGSGGVVVQGGAGAASIGANLAGLAGVTNAGTLTLAGSNSFTGGIANTGTLIAGSTSAFAGNDLAANAGTVDLNANSNSVGTLSGNVAATITNNTTGTATLTTTSTVDSGYAGVLQDGGAGKVLSLTKTGASVLTLSGNSSYSGTTTLLQGSLGLGHNNALGVSTLVLGGSGSQSPTIFATGGARVLPNSLLLGVATAGTATIGGTDDVTINGSVTLNGSRTLANDNTGATTLAGPVFLSDNDASAGRVLTLTGGGVTVSGGIANNNAGNTVAAGITYNGTGRLILAGNNTYTGNTTISAGTLQLQANAGNTTGTTVNMLGVGGTLVHTAGTPIELRGDTTGVTFTGFNNLGLANGTAYTFDVNRLSSGSGATLGINGFAVQNSTINVTGGNGYTLSLGGVGESLSNNGDAHTTTYNPTTANLVTGGMASTGGVGGTSTMQWVLDGTSAANVVAGVINNGQNNTRVTSVTKSNSSTWTLSGNNTYQGVTTVNAGTLKLAGAGTLGNGNAGLTVNGGTLDLGGVSRGVGALNGSGGTITNSTASTTSTLTVGNNNATGGSHAGVIADGSGVVAITKTGTGIQTLTGANTYSGSTTVTTGTLSITQPVLADSSSVVIGVNGILNLPYVGTDQVASLSLNGTVHTSGTFHSGNSGGLITGDGQIRVGPAVAGYSGWAAGFPFTAGVNDGAEQDADGDGIKNVLEYVFGGIPVGPGSSDLATITPVRELTPSHLKLTFRRSDLSEADTTLKVQWSTNLTVWNDFATIGGGDALPAVDVSEDSPNPDLDKVEVYIPRANEVNGRLYGRVIATTP